MSSDWFDELESRLNAKLEQFLEANPAQEALLQQQEQAERRQDLIRRRRQLQGEAERERQILLQLAEDIRQWQQRIQRARDAGALELAERAEGHCASLMERGRLAWDQLGRLGETWEAINQELAQLQDQERRARPRNNSRPMDLEQEWAAFETNQDLERLKRRPT
jgi:hercynine metabolism protein